MEQTIKDIYDSILQAEKSRDNDSAWFLMQNLVWGVIKGKCEVALGIPYPDQTDDQQEGEV